MTTAIRTIPIEQWSAQLEDALKDANGLIKRVVVLQETDSTQGAARRLDAREGDMIVAWRQTSGRGRLGHTWADTGEAGVAVTFVLPRDRPERMAIASAVATADAIVATMKGTNGWQNRKMKVGIKWPNDVIVDSRKIAGVLVEQSDDRAFVGIGINVLQQSWPAELRDRAISLAELEFDIDRLVVVDVLMQSLAFILREDDEQLAARFREMDVLAGTTCGFRCGEREVRGRVLRIDPMRGLAVETTEGEVWLPAATTNVLKE